MKISEKICYVHHQLSEKALNMNHCGLKIKERPKFKKLCSIYVIFIKNHDVSRMIRSRPLIMAGEKAECIFWNPVNFAYPLQTFHEFFHTPTESSCNFSYHCKEEVHWSRHWVWGCGSIKWFLHECLPACNLCIHVIFGYWVFLVDISYDRNRTY